MIVSNLTVGLGAKDIRGAWTWVLVLTMEKLDIRYRTVSCETNIGALGRRAQEN
jgi:hypothetical protein